jgi:hypothetical protein
VKLPRDPGRRSFPVRALSGHALALVGKHFGGDAEAALTSSTTTPHAHG